MCVETCSVCIQMVQERSAEAPGFVPEKQTQKKKRKHVPAVAAAAAGGPPAVLWVKVCYG